MNTRTITTIGILTTAILLFGLVVVPNLGNTHDVEAKSKTGKIDVEYKQLGGYEGKAKIKILNRDNEGKVLVKADINFAKLRASEGDDCFFKVYTFKWDGNQVGDSIGIKVSAEGASWTGVDELEKGTTNLSMGLEEIGCHEECE